MSFVFNSPQLFGLHLDENDDPIIFQEEKKGDLVVVQGFKGSDGVYVTVRRIGPIVKEIRKLCCSIAKLKVHSTLRLGFQVVRFRKWKRTKSILKITSCLFHLICWVVTT